MSQSARIYDRALVIDQRDEIDQFMLDPRGFLEKVGAFKGLDQFNGVVREDGTDIIDLELFLRGKERLISVHIGTPYVDACKWLLF